MTNLYASVSTAKPAPLVFYCITSCLKGLNGAPNRLANSGPAVGGTRRGAADALSLRAEAAACSGGRPVEVPGRLEASKWWVVMQLFAVARWRPRCRRHELHPWSSTVAAFQIVSPAAEVDFGPRQSLWSAAAPSSHASWVSSCRLAKRFSRASFAKALQLLCGETQRKARGGATQHTMLSGSAAGLICVPCIFDRRKLSGEATRWRLC